MLYRGLRLQSHSRAVIVGVEIQCKHRLEKWTYQLDKHARAIKLSFPCHGKSKWRKDFPFTEWRDDGRDTVRVPDSVQHILLIKTSSLFCIYPAVCRRLANLCAVCSCLDQFTTTNIQHYHKMQVEQYRDFKKRTSFFVCLNLHW